MNSKTHIMDVWQSEISNLFLNDNYDGQTNGQKKRLIGAQALALAKNEFKMVLCKF